VSSGTCSLAVDAGEGSWQRSVSRRSWTSLILLPAMCHHVPTSLYPNTCFPTPPHPNATAPAHLHFTASQCYRIPMPLYPHVIVSQHHRIPMPSYLHVAVSQSSYPNTTSQHHHIPTPSTYLSATVSQHHHIHQCHHIPVLL